MIDPKNPQGLGGFALCEIMSPEPDGMVFQVADLPRAYVLAIELDQILRSIISAGA